MLIAARGHSARRIMDTLRYRVSPIASWLLVAAIVSLAVPFVYLFPAETRLLGFQMGTIHNAVVLAAIVLAAFALGVRRWLSPVLAASLLLLLIGFTLSSRLPGLSVMQSFRTFLTLVLGACVFELRLDRRAWRPLLATLPWIAIINLALGLLLQLVTERFAYRMDWGAFRLSGTVVPSHLAYLGVSALIFSLLQAAKRPRSSLIVIANLAIIVWTGTRSAIGEATILILAWLIAEMIGARKRGLKRWTPWRLAVLAAIPICVLSYSPFIGKRLHSFHSHRAEGLSFQLPFGDKDDVKPSDSNKDSRKRRKRKIVDTYDRDTKGSSSGAVRISTTGRLRAWKFFWKTAQENLWFGRGLGAGVTAARGHLPEAFQVPHNEYLRLIVDAGYVGLGVFMLAYLIQWLGAIRQLGQSSSVIMTLTVLALLAVDSVLRNPLTAQHFMIPVWLFLATQLARAGQNADKSAHGRREPPQ